MSDRLEPELERVARMLAEAGPLPDAPESLRERALAIPDGGPVADDGRVVPARRPVRRRRLAAVLGVAAAVAAIAIAPAALILRQDDGPRSIDLVARAFAPGSGGTAEVVAHGDGSATIHLRVWKMPTPGAGRVYETWLGRKGERKPLGVFEIDENGAATLDYTVDAGHLGGYDWLWVTSEPQGTSTTPSDKTALWGPVT